MLQWAHLEVFGPSRRDSALVFILLFNAFTWGYITITFIESLSISPGIKIAFNGVFYIAASGSVLSGAFMSEKIKRLRFLYLWMTIGLICSSLLILINYVALAHLSVIFILLGLSYGFGLPSSLAYFADNSTVENRAFFGAVILLGANLGALPLAVLFPMSDPVVNAVALTVWRGLGLVCFILIKPRRRENLEKEKAVTFVSVLQDRSFHLYLLPWIMFLLIDAMEKSLLSSVVDLDIQRLMGMIEPLVAVFFTIVGGLFADRIGRKRMSIYGFVALGVGYAFVGLGFGTPMERIAWYFYIVMDGAAWGILLTIFLMTLWGDLSRPGAKEKYYAAGNFPFLARSAISLAVTTAIVSVPENAAFPATAAFSLASFFLFLAVLPLMYAPETLPQKKIELRRLKRYVEQAKKLAGNAQKKGSED